MNDERDVGVSITILRMMAEAVYCRAVQSSARFLESVLCCSAMYCGAMQCIVMKCSIFLCSIVYCGEVQYTLYV